MAEPNLQQATDLVTEARRILDDVRYNARSPEGLVTETDWSRLGSASDYLEQTLPYIRPPDPTPVPTPPDPEPPPAPPTISGVAVTYAGHNPARDCYLGYTAEQVAWGPHHGIPLIAPADGVVSLYSFPTPLAPRAVGYAQYMRNHQALFGGAAAGGFICGLAKAQLRVTGQTMYFVLFVPTQPLVGLRALWFGHVRGNATLGPVQAGEWFGESWDSGIRFETAGIPNARAAHVHCCASATGNLSMNGDVDGLRAAAAMGWQVELVGSTGPGPDQYLGGRYCAGRLLQDFTRGGHPIPPLPPS